MELGLSGHLTRIFIRSPLTPLLLLAALVLGIIALVSLAREEEPQISVPMVDILVRADGLKAGDVVELVTKPLEEIVKGIDDVEHTYSQTGDDRTVVTARFRVGTDSDNAILRVHEKIRANLDRIPLVAVDDVGLTYLVGGRPDQIRVEPDPERLALYGVTLNQLVEKVKNANRSFIVGQVRSGGGACRSWPGRRFRAPPISACCW
jgi:multidrug efflux pump subunit AcrB